MCLLTESNYSDYKNIGRKHSRVKAHDSQYLISADAANALLSLSHRNVARQQTATGVSYVGTMGQANNVATFTLASEHEHCRAFCCETDMIDERPDDVITLPASFISDYEDDDEPTALLLS
jgi:hypothetical protein